MSKRLSRLNKSRSQRPARFPYLGNYLIITNTRETESNYFNGLKKSISNHAHNNILIKVHSNRELASIVDFAVKERNMNPNYSAVWIIFDYDGLEIFNDLIRDMKKANIQAGWSNPCFEIWLSAYFEEMKTSIDSQHCYGRFETLLVKHTSRTSYDKSDPEIYDVLYRHGDESEAINIAKRRYENKLEECSAPSDMDACTTVYQLVEEIRSKAQLFHVSG